MVIAEKLQRERISKRGDTSLQDVAGFLELTTQRREDQRAFLENYTPDFTIHSDTEIVYTITFLKQRIQDPLAIDQQG